MITTRSSYCALQELFVFSLILRDLDEPPADPIRVAGIPKVIVRQARESPCIESILKLFNNEDIVEVLNVYSGVNHERSDR